MIKNLFESEIYQRRKLKYLNACGGDVNKAALLYKLNKRISATIFTLIGEFEIIIRNQIDIIYKKKWGNEWLKNESHNENGFLKIKGCERSAEIIENCIKKFNSDRVYNHDRLLSDLSFAFWEYMFESKQYRAGGNILLNIFPKRPKNTKQNDIFKKLKNLVKLRNKVYHHSQVCINKNDKISSEIIIENLEIMKDLIEWMDIDFEAIYDSELEILLNDLHKLES